MSFASTTDIRQLIAVQGDDSYHISALDIKLNLGGSVTAFFTVAGKVEKKSGIKITDLSEFTKKDAPKKLSEFEIGSPVTLKLVYYDGPPIPKDPKNSKKAEEEEKSKEKTIELFSGRIKAINDSARMTGKSLTIGRGYTLSSELDFVDNIPLGSLFIPKQGSAQQATWLAPAYMSSTVDILTGTTKSNRHNIAKLTANLIDVHNPTKKGDGVHADSVAIQNKISDRIRVDRAPLLSGVQYTAALGENIFRSVSAGYASQPPLALFNQIISKFFLVCAPRTDGKADVVANNGWKKIKEDKNTAADIGYDLIVGINMLDAPAQSTGFDGIIVDTLEVLNTKTNNATKAESGNYYLCTEVFDKQTNRPKLIFGKAIVTPDGVQLAGSDEKIAVKRLRKVHLTDWMTSLTLSDSGKKAGEDSYKVGTFSNMLWAKWLTYGAYAQLNRVSNRVSLDLRLSGYEKFANRIGDILSFNVPGNSEKFYGRLISIGLQIGLTYNQLSCRVNAVLDCVRDETDNKNLCSDFALYEDNPNGKK